MKKLLVFAAAAMLISTVANAQTTVREAVEAMTPAQRDMAFQALIHYDIGFVRPDGTYVSSRSDPEFETLVQYSMKCDYGVAMGISNNSVTSPAQAASEKTRCLQWWIDTGGLHLTATLTYH